MVEKNTVFKIGNLNAWYGKNHVLKGIEVAMQANKVTALIGPSGCGKSTFLRCLNRMNDFIRDFRLEGNILLRGEDLYSPDIDKPIPKVHLRQHRIRPADLRREEKVRTRRHSRREP